MKRLNQTVVGQSNPRLPKSSRFRKSVEPNDFNWVAQPGSLVKLWYNPPSPALTDAALVFLKEGAAELTSPVTSTTPGSTPVHNFSGVTVIGELDELELRNGSGLTIAQGTRNTGLAEPT